MTSHALLAFHAALDRLGPERPSPEATAAAFCLSTLLHAPPSRVYSLEILARKGTIRSRWRITRQGPLTAEGTHPELSTHGDDWLCAAIAIHAIHHNIPFPATQRGGQAKAYLGAIPLPHHRAHLRVLPTAWNISPNAPCKVITAEMVAHSSHAGALV